MISAKIVSPKCCPDRWQIFACLLLIPLPLFLPYLWLSHFYFWSSSDSIYYLNAYTGYRDALWHGEFHPRWVQNMDIGYGNLLFYDRSPLPYSLTAIINAPLFLSDQNQFILGLYASQVFGAWAMWRWLKEHYDKKTARAGALIFTLIPYTLLMIYTHFNLAQCWAMAFIPLWFHAAEHLDKRNGIFTFALAGAMCGHAHLLTFVSVAPTASFYALYIRQWQWRSMIWPMVKAKTLMGCLLAGYLASMITSMPWLHVDSWTAGSFNSLKNLNHADDKFCFYMLFIAWLFYTYRKPVTKNVRYFWLVTLIVFYILATPLSYPLWANIKALNIFQFPFDRLQPVMEVAVTIIGVDIVSVRNRSYTKRVFYILAAFALWIGLYVQSIYSFHGATDVTPSTQPIVIQDKLFPTRMNADFNLPKWTLLTEKFLLENHEQLETLPRLVVKNGKANVTLLSEGNGWMKLHTQVTSPFATIVLSQFYVPAWQAFSDGQAVEVIPSEHDGFISMTLPEGSHDVQVMVVKNALEKTGDILAMIALALYLMHYTAMAIQTKRVVYKAHV